MNCIALQFDNNKSLGYLRIFDAEVTPALENFNEFKKQTTTGKTYFSVLHQN